MKRSLILLPLVAALAACGSISKDPFEKRAEQERSRQEASAARAIDNAPKWMTELPKSNSAIYQNGTAVSSDMGMSVNKAKTMAFGKLCMSAGPWFRCARWISRLRQEFRCSVYVQRRVYKGTRRLAK